MGIVSERHGKRRCRARDGRGMRGLWQYNGRLIRLKVQYRALKIDKPGPLNFKINDYSGRRMKKLTF